MKKKENWKKDRNERERQNIKEGLRRKRKKIKEGAPCKRNNENMEKQKKQRKKERKVKENEKKIWCLDWKIERKW